MDHTGSFYKGYIKLSPELEFQFAVQHNECSIRIDFTVQLLDLEKLDDTSW